MEMTPAAQASLVQFFKALADENRLKIAGLLASRSRSAEELAAALTLRPAVLAHHLARLMEAGLISQSAHSQPRLYALRQDALHRLAAQIAGPSARPDLADEIDPSDRGVLSVFLTADGALRELPAQEKKLLAVLRYVNDQIEPGRPYTEKEINALLARFHPDTASLRRYLIDHRLLKRDAAGRRYWKSEAADPPPA